MFQAIGLQRIHPTDVSFHFCEISQHLLDGLVRNLEHTFMVDYVLKNLMMA